MQHEWKTYRKELVKVAKTLLLTLGVSLLFYIASIPNLNSGEHLQSLVISLTHGFAIFFWIWIFHLSLRWIFKFLKIKTGRPLVITGPMNVTLSISGMAIGIISARWIVSYMTNQSFDLDGIWNSLLIGAFITFMFQFYFAYRHSMAENAELRELRMAAELHVLKNQMQPHFLFNSLNSLAELIDSNKNHASIMTQNLADLYREILENSKVQVASLASEISIIKKYLELEKLRFGDRLHYSISVPKNEENIFLPSLVLQTLVENAIKHAISKSISGGEIQVRVQENEDGNGYRAEIFNNGFPENTKGTNGTGLANTKSRLDLLYGKQHQFEFKIKDSSAQVSFWFSGDRIGQ